MNKKTKIAIISVIALILVTIAVTYAYWTYTRSQTNPNAVGAACLDIEITNEGSAISLANQFPITDEAGLESSPYTFTVKNNCNTSIDYQVALEAIGTESTSLKTSSMKVALNDAVSLLSDNAEVDTTIEGAYESRKLLIETLEAKGTAAYELRIWIDADAPVSENNKTFTSKISVTVGEGIKKPIIAAEGTLADAILSSYGGVDSVVALDETIKDHRIVSTSDYYISASSNYYYGTEYTLDETTGKYTLSGTLTQATTTECRNGTKTCGKYTFKNTSSTYSSGTIFEIINWNSDKGENYVLLNTFQYTTTFGGIETGSSLNKTEDDLGDSYYFRGIPTNNYVEFGTYNEDKTIIKGYYSSNSTGSKEYATLAECNAATSYNYNCTEFVYAKRGEPMYWRIVRINGDGTIRLIYDGLKATDNGTVHTAIIGESKYNNNSSDPVAKYVGYTYDDGTGTQVDSLIKAAVDTWYDTHLESKYGDYIADSIFCNDRSSRIDDNGGVFYGSYDRFTGQNKPSVKCANKADRYTVNDTTNGNGLLSNPVGLITIDELVFAGSNFNGATDKKSYVYSGNSYWTSSPVTWNDSGDTGATVWFVDHGENNLDMNMFAGTHFGYLTNTVGVRPVINLKADVAYTGNGTIGNPYKIITE